LPAEAAAVTQTAAGISRRSLPAPPKARLA